MKDVILKILAILVPMLLEALKGLLNNEQFVKFGDKLLDWCERMIEAKEDWYDKHLLDLIKLVREAANIPDLPDA